jgi:hypothetical protein
MYASSFLNTLTHVEDTAKSTVDDVSHLGHSKTADRNLISILKALSDYRTLIDRIDFIPPEEQPAGADIVTWHVKQKQNGKEIKYSEVPEQYQDSDVEGDLIQVFENKILIPLAGMGPMAYSWLPLLESLLIKLEDVIEYMDILQSRASVDSNGFVESIWSSLYYYTKVTYRLTKVKYISHKTRFDYRGELHDIRRNTNKVG